jgi:hypothetical protein
VRALVAVLLLGGCDATLAEYDDIYERGAPTYVECAMSIDDKSAVSYDEIGAALDRAQLDGTTLELYAHKPVITIEPSTIDIVLASVADRGMKFATYADLSDHQVPGSLCLSFDDDDVDGWTSLRPIFLRYGARATFFVTRYPEMTDSEKAELRQLADDGHDIEYHGTHHVDAAAYSAANGIDAWLAYEITPGLAAMRADGWNPILFAYPHGARTDATDEALRPLFGHIRAIRSTCPY